MHNTCTKTNWANTILALPAKVALGKKTGLYALAFLYVSVSMIQYIAGKINLSNNCCYYIK